MRIYELQEEDGRIYRACVRSDGAVCVTDESGQAVRASTVAGTIEGAWAEARSLGFTIMARRGLHALRAATGLQWTELSLPIPLRDYKRIRS